MVRWLSKRRDDRPEDIVRAQLHALLAARRGWKLEAQSTPGLASEWCFGPGLEAELAVDVRVDGLVVYVLDPEVELAFPDCGELESWLDANEHLFLDRATMPPKEFELMMEAKLTGWRSDGR